MMRPIGITAVVRITLSFLLCHDVASGLAVERRPWDVLRFLQQSSKFVRFPFSSTNEISVSPGETLWRLGDKNTFTMAPLDDVVMGGASASSFNEITGTWSGSVTEANNGGFVGIRTSPGDTWNLQNCKGVEWKVKLVSPSKSKNRFKFVLRDSSEFNGITWTTSVDLKPGLNNVKINFANQIPALFAKTLSDKTFKKDSVASFQIVYSKYEYDAKLNPNFTAGYLELQVLELGTF